MQAQGWQREALGRAHLVQGDDGDPVAQAPLAEQSLGRLLAVHDDLQGRVIAYISCVLPAWKVGRSCFAGEKVHYPGLVLDCRLSKSDAAGICKVWPAASAIQTHMRVQVQLHALGHRPTWYSLPPAATSRAVVVAGSCTLMSLATTPFTLLWAKFASGAWYWKLTPAHKRAGQCFKQRWPQKPGTGRF